MRDKLLGVIVFLVGIGLGVVMASRNRPQNSMEQMEEMAKALRECEAELDAR